MSNVAPFLWFVETEHYCPKEQYNNYSPHINNARNLELAESRVEWQAIEDRGEWTEMKKTTRRVDKNEENNNSDTKEILLLLIGGS